MKKIAVLSDIHGNIQALEAVCEDFKRKKVNQIINLGDHISGPLWPRETLEFLMKQDWIHIAGNHDRNLIYQKPEEMGLSDSYTNELLSKNEKKWLGKLPDSLELNGLFIFHGTPLNDNQYLLETVEYGRARLATQSEIKQKLGKEMSIDLLCGHSHIPRVVKFGDSVIVNPGSVGLQAYDDELPEYHIMETGSPHARYAVIEFQARIRSIEIISVPYDYQSAIKQALKNNRNDWAKGLESGTFSECII